MVGTSTYCMAKIACPLSHSLSRHAKCFSMFIRGQEKVFLKIKTFVKIL